jgi:hypothetical protein
VIADGKLQSHDQKATITIPEKLKVGHKGHTISINRDDVLDHVINHGDAIGSCQ